MKALNILLVVVLIGAAGVITMELFDSKRLADPTDRCVEAVPAARRAFEAGPMARNGLRATELNAPSRVDPPQDAPPGLILCRAEAVFSSGAHDTMWYALIPTQGSESGQFMIHAAPGELGRRNVVAAR